MVPDFSNDAVWSALIQKAVAARHPAPGRFRMISDALSGIIRREGPGRANQLIGLPLGGLYRYSVRWWQELADSVTATGWDFRKIDIHRASCRADLLGLASAVWPPLSGVDPDFHLQESFAGGGIWTFHELVSQTELLLEGRYLKHCVARYRKKCETGVSALFSLRYQNPNGLGMAPEPQVTLEILRDKRRIVQIRGKWNRRPTETERSLIAGWASRHQLIMAA